MSINQHEEALVLAAQKGDTNAFEKLYQLYYDKIYALIMMTVKNSSDAEDILQLTFVKAWKNISKLSDPKAFNTWLQRIALNESNSMLRKKRPVLSVDDEGENGELLQLESDLLLPQEYAERDDLSARLRKIIEELSVVQRDTILLFYYNDLSIEEIAQIMDCSEGTVKSRLFLARKAIKTEIEELERKSGEKFYGSVMLPLGPMFNSLVRSQSLSPETALNIWNAVNQSIKEAATASTVGSVAASTAAKTGLSLGAKITIGVITGITLIGGSAFGVSQLLKPHTTPASAAFGTADQAGKAQEIVTNQAAPAAEAPTETYDSEAFKAYLEKLKTNESHIRMYDWQMKNGNTDSAEPRPIAFADVFSDDIPEMIFAGKNMDQVTDLSIVTYEDDQAIEVCFDERFDVFASIGTEYYLFTVKGEKALYCYQEIGDESQYYSINRYTEDTGEDAPKGMIKQEYLSYIKDNSGNTVLKMNEETVSADTFNTARSNVLNNVERVMMKGTSGGFMEEDVREVMEAKENISMTYEEAFTLLGGDSNSLNAEKAELNQEYLNTVKGKYCLYDGNNGFVEITGDGRFVRESSGFQAGEEVNSTSHQIVGIDPLPGGGYNISFETDGAKDYVTVYMEGDMPSGDMPSELLNHKGRLKQQTLQDSNFGAPFVRYE